MFKLFFGTCFQSTRPRTLDDGDDDRTEIDGEEEGLAQDSDPRTPIL